MNITVARLIIVPTGVYNPPVHRNYSVDARNRDNVTTLTQEATQGGQNFAPAAMTQLASKILVPSASMGEVYIPNSFSERRFRFMMEVRHDDGAIQYLSGYTDKLDAINGHIAPDTMLHFNMTYTVRMNKVTNANGHKSHSTTIVDASQVLSAPQLTDQNALGGLNSNIHGDSAVTLRPSDVFSISEALNASNELNRISKMQGDSSPVTIKRTSGLGAEFRTGIRKSRITNNLASRYLSDTIGAYTESESLADTGSAFFSKWDQASTTLAEPTTGSDRFLTPTQRIGHQLSNGGSLPWSTLTAIAPEVVEQARMSLAQSTRGQTIDGRNGEFTGSNTLEAITCSKVLNGLPAIMGANFVTKVSIMARSGLVVGMGTLLDEPTSASNQNARVDVLTYNTFNSKDQSQGVAKSMAYSFLNEILSDISQGFQRDVTVYVTLDTLGDTEISIGYGNDKPTTFYNPTFCSALSSPILATSQTALSSLASDFSNVFRGASTNPW